MKDKILELSKRAVELEVNYEEIRHINELSILASQAGLPKREVEIEAINELCKLIILKLKCKDLTN